MASKVLLTRILRGSLAGRFPNQPGHQLHLMKVNMGILQNYSNRPGFVFIGKEDSFGRYGSILPPRAEDSFIRYGSILYPREDVFNRHGNILIPPGVSMPPPPPPPPEHTLEGLIGFPGKPY